MNELEMRARHIETLRAVREDGGTVADDAYTCAIDAAITALSQQPSAVVDDAAGVLRELLAERGHRTDGDLVALAQRCLHLSRGDKDLISIRGNLIQRLSEQKVAGVPEGAVEVLRHALCSDGHAVTIVFESQEKAGRYRERLNEAMQLQQNAAAPKPTGGES